MMLQHIVVVAAAPISFIYNSFVVRCFAHKIKRIAQFFPLSFKRKGFALIVTHSY
jgi:hypothetical protein